MKIMKIMKPVALEALRTEPVLETGAWVTQPVKGMIRADFDQLPIRTPCGMCAVASVLRAHLPDQARLGDLALLAEVCTDGGRVGMVRENERAEDLIGDHIAKGRWLNALSMVFETAFGDRESTIAWVETHLPDEFEITINFHPDFRPDLHTLLDE
jgi:hypothetical protein